MFKHKRKYKYIIMSIDIKIQSLYPVRRDKQIAASTGAVSLSSGSVGGGGSGTGDVNKTYVDSSLSTRDISINKIDASTKFWKPYVDGSLNKKFDKTGGTISSHVVLSQGNLSIDQGHLFCIDASIEGTLQVGNFSLTDALTVPSLIIDDAASALTTFSVTGDEFTIIVDGGELHLDAQGGIWTNTQLYLSSPTNVSTGYSLYFNPTTKLVSYAANDYANKTANIKYITSLYTLTSDDNNFIIEASGTFGIYFPASLNTGFRVDIMNKGGGTITLNASTGCTMFATDGSINLRKAGAAASVYKSSSTQWCAAGGLS